MITPRSLRERSVFVDTPSFYALLDRSDRRHSEAREGFGRLAQERRPLFTSNLIVPETYVLMRHALLHGATILPRQGELPLLQRTARKRLTCRTAHLASRVVECRHAPAKRP